MHYALVCALHADVQNSLLKRIHLTVLVSTFSEIIFNREQVNVYKLYHLSCVKKNNSYLVYTHRIHTSISNICVPGLIFGKYGHPNLKRTN